MPRSRPKPTWTSREARRERFIPVMRDLVRAYQAFERADAGQHRQRGLTTPQADVIFTLGNTEGLTFKELGERTLITKGTLTGVVDRLEAKRLTRRVASASDRRCTRVLLTAAGQRLFEEVYPQHIAFLKERFDRLGEDDLSQLQAMLRRLREIF